jgi:thiamine biosynthesis protein ThiI
MKILIRVYPEIIIKSKQVRTQFIKRLRTNTKEALKQIDRRIEVKALFDRLEINLPFDDEKTLIDACLVKLQKIPGIDEIQIYEEFPFADKADLYEKTFALIKDDIAGKSFAVRAKRRGKSAISGMDVSRELGAYIMKNAAGVSVNLTQPDFTVYLDVNTEIARLIAKRIRGIGGFPVGSQQHVLSLISGGFDSTVSTYLMMKKGLKVDFLFFNLGGDVHEIGVKEVSHFLAQEFSDGYQPKFITINFEKIVAELLTAVHHRYRGIILKRLFIKACNELFKTQNYHAIITGESLGQVSSQTLINLNVITDAAEELILRPLLALGKMEIIDIARKIGTEAFASKMPEFCGVVSDRPATAAKLADVLSEETRFNMDLLHEAVANKTVMKVRDFVNMDKINVDIEVASFPKPDDVVIDVRDEEKAEARPLSYANVQHVPFFKINQQFKDFDQSKTYAFYCDKGVISNLVASNLKQQGFDNVKILRPLDKNI